MGERALNKAFEYIDAMAAKLGVASEHVYEILVRRALISGLLKVIIGISVIVFIVLTFRKIIKWITTGGDEDNLLFAYIIGGFASTSLVAIFIAILFDGIMSVVNPEYYAIKEILDIIKGGR